MDEFKDFYTGQNYNQHMYNGLIGYFMTLSHKRMENSTEKKKRVLEIGPGTHPHINYLKHDFEEYYVVDRIKELSSFFVKNEKIKFVHQEGDSLPFEDDYFDRIIISHCLEHIVNPELVLRDIYSKLNKGRKKKGLDNHLRGFRTLRRRGRRLRRRRARGGTRRAR